MKRELAMEFSRVTEAAALATYNHIGLGDKIKADDAAVRAMRLILNTIDFAGEVVIGEGEIDEAPMLYIGERVGSGTDPVDIAVDPIDGTRMVALGQDNAVAVMVLAKAGTLLKAPDMYMEKIMVNNSGRGKIDLNLSVVENIKVLSKHLNKPLNEMKIMTLSKPRHEQTIKDIQALGCKVVAVPDGDVEASVLVAMPETDVDMYYGIGGAPEGVISAAIMRAMSGDMQARLMTRIMCKENTAENIKISSEEELRLSKLSLDCSQILKLDDLASSDDLIVSMTGITNGSLLSGCTIKGNLGKTQTLLVRGKSRTIRKIESTHYLDRKDEELVKIIKGECNEYN